MSDINIENSHRAEIALRTQRRVLDDRVRKLTVAVFGLMGYSAFSNFMGAFASFGSAIATPTLGTIGVLAFGLLLGALYSLGAYRVWFKDDIRWWPVAIPAGISIALSILAFTAGKPAVIPLIINVALLAIVPFRIRATAAAVAIASKPLSASASFKDV
ncbi:hypothetical protein [Rhodanobacter thiooxydans]|uniref:hypothetical protein n=1 Tax=Rhodanobacter thiooxydans TaxID=416169 RepID=UPI00128FF9DC|nr:hypothetical protein [Rhodanobacter thiooxydans]